MLEKLKNIFKKKPVAQRQQSFSLFQYQQGMSTNINDMIERSRTDVNNRINNLVRYFPLFAKGIDIVSDYVVGAGLEFQSKIKGRKRLNEKVEYAFRKWAEKPTACGKMEYGELQELEMKMLCQKGEILIIKEYQRVPGRFLPYQLKPIDPDLLSDFGAKQFRKDSELSQGIEYDKSSGRVIGYHFSDPDSFTGGTISKKAEDVIHTFKHLAPGQIRGLSELVSGILLADSMSDLISSEVRSSELASRFLGIITTPTPYEHQLNSLSTDPYDATNTNNVLELEHSIMTYLRPGEDVKLMHAQRPKSDLIDFLDLLTRIMATILCVPYEILSSNYQQLSYSTVRMARSDYANRIRNKTKRFVRYFCNPTVLPFYDIAVASGALSLPGYFTNPERFHEFVFTSESQFVIDPLKETKADIEALQNQLESPQRIARKRGYDYDDLIAEIQEANMILEQSGLKGINNAETTNDNTNF